MNNNDRKMWQGELRRSLERQAFNEKYECLICGKKENLHVHHLIYTEDKEAFLNPRYWRILCMKCHGQIPKRYKARPEKIKKKLIVFELRSCRNCAHDFMPKREEQRFCKRGCQKDYWRKVFHDKPSLNRRLDKIEEKLGIK